MKNNILLIGGYGGIGLETAKNMAVDQNVYIASRSCQHLENLNITHLPFDVLKDDISQLDLPETIDGLVYCQGSMNLKPFKMLSPTVFEEELQLNFLGPVKVVQGLLPELKKSEQASLVFFSTVAVKVGMPFYTSVAAAKGAVEGFAKALAPEYAPHFRINVIAPSLTNTQLAATLLSTEEKKKKMGERNPLKRVGEVRDIANLVTFLLFDKSSWMMGQILGMDGGMSPLNIN